MEVTFPGEGSSGEEEPELFWSWSERKGPNAIIAVSRRISIFHQAAPAQVVDERTASSSRCSIETPLVKP